MKRNVLLVDFGDTGAEAEAIRQTLECFDYYVLKLPVGRPNDLIEILDGSADHFEYNYLILSCHGASGVDDGKILMPILHEDCYLDGEPRSHFGGEQIAAYNGLEHKVIISTGCSTGKDDSMIAAFSGDHNNIFIAPNDDPEGSSTLHFVQSFFYHLKNADTKTAFERACRTDCETAMFKMYS